MIFSKRRACCCEKDCNALSCCYACFTNCSQFLILCGCIDGDECPEESPFGCACAFSSQTQGGGIELSCEPCEIALGVGGGLCDCEDVEDFGTILYYEKKCVTCRYYGIGGDPFIAFDENAEIDPNLDLCYVAASGITEGTGFGEPIFNENDSGQWGWTGGTGNFVTSGTTPCPLIYPGTEDSSEGLGPLPLAEVIYCECSGCTMGGPGLTANINGVIYNMIGIDTCT